jgi:hypothetical protein
MTVCHPGVFTQPVLAAVVIAIGVSAMAREVLANARTGKNVRNALSDMSWRSVFGRRV